MSNRFHNKYHRHNHHTIPTNPSRYPDSSYDPIASRESPFKGEFYSEGQITTTEALSALGTLYATDGQFYGVVNIDNTLTVVGNALFNSNVTVDQNLLVQGNATVVGDLTVSGELTYLDTIVSVTSALSVVNAGTGPALTVLQTGSQAVADFIDLEGGSALFVDGTTSAPGYVGINTRTPNERLTIVGNVSSNSDRVAFNLSRATGVRSFASGTGLASGSHSTAHGLNTVASGDYSSTEGGNTTASGLYSHAEGVLSQALGEASHAAGFRATAAQNYTYAWAGNSTLTQNVSTTRTGQYMVSATGGVFIPGNVGIGTDNNTNALTVQGTLSARGNAITTGSSFVSGNQIVGGDVEVRGGDLTTNQTTFNLLNATATTVNFAGAGTAITIGATTGSTNVRNNLNVSGILSANNNFITTGNSFVSGNEIVRGDVEIRGGDLTTNQTTFNLLDTTATTVNFARAATTINVGSNAGTLTVGNPTVVGTQTTQNLYNTVATTVNAFGAATSLTFGSTTGSTNVRNNLNISGVLSSNNGFITTGSSFISGNHVVGGDVEVRGGDLTTNQTTFNLLDTTATTVNFARAGTAITIGATTGSTNVRNNLNVSGILSANSLIYSQELDFGSLERPSLTGIKAALNSFLYVNPAISYLRINGSTSQVLEVGQALVTPTITWTSNKVEPQAVSNYLLTLPNSNSTSGTLTFTFSSYSDPNTYNITTIGGTATQQVSSWSVRVTDWSGAQATTTSSANWRYRVYFGVTSSATPNSSDILSGVTSDTNRPLAISRTGLGAKTVSPSNQYFYVAYPQRFQPTSTLRVNGLNFTDFTQQSIATFTNASGGTDSYYVYRSNNLLTATYTIEII